MSENNLPLGILAASGAVPLQLARAAEASGRPVFVACLVGLADPKLAEFPHINVKWGQVSKVFRYFGENAVREVVFIGAVDQRPDVRAIGFDMGVLHLMPQLLNLNSGGDDSVLRGVMTVFEDHGFKIVGAHDVDMSLTVAAGSVAGPVPSRLADDARIALKAAEALGSLDVGQAAIAVNRRVVAVEGAEGTDSMIERVQVLRRDRRVQWKGREGVLAKRSKPHQDLRIDMPAIGPKTVQAVADAGLAGIVVEARRVLVAERDETLRLADATGTYIQAVTLEEISG